MPAVPALIMAGASIYAAHKQSSAGTKAAETANQGIEKGIDLQREMYQQDRADDEPYRNLGVGALGNLAYLSGINLPPPTPKPTQQQLSAASGVRQSVEDQARSTLSSLGQPASDFNRTVTSRAMGNLGDAQSRLAQRQMVAVKAPNGKVGLVPADKLPQALAAGGQRVL